MENLSVSLPIRGRPQAVILDVDLQLDHGETLAIVGESGAGKSMTARAVARLLPTGARATGSVRWGGEDVLGLRGQPLRRHRRRIGVVLQDPRASVNPVRRIGDHLREALGRMPGARADARAAQALDEVGIDDPERRLRQLPDELSGGMLQRVSIAAALLHEPELLLADEATTALDVTTQAAIIELLRRLRQARGMALLVITHDLDFAATVCDRTAVMYAGRIVETAASSTIYRDAAHPYSKLLALSRPIIGQRRDRLPVIPGRPVSAFEAPSGCPFRLRCALADEECEATLPPLRTVGESAVRCHRAEAVLDGGLPLQHDA